MVKVPTMARLLNVSPDTIRYYTRIGILRPSHSENGYYSYTGKEVQRLRFIIHAKRLGFSLAGIKNLIEISASGEMPCPGAREIIASNLEKLGKSIEESLSLLRRMKSAVAVWSGMPDQQPDGYSICTLIEDWEEEITP